MPKTKRKSVRWAFGDKLIIGDAVLTKRHGNNLMLETPTEMTVQHVRAVRGLVKVGKRLLESKRPQRDASGRDPALPGE